MINCVLITFDKDVIPKALYGFPHSLIISIAFLKSKDLHFVHVAS